MRDCRLTPRNLKSGDLIPRPPARSRTRARPPAPAPAPAGRGRDRPCPRRPRPHPHPGRGRPRLRSAPGRAEQVPRRPPAQIRRRRRPPHRIRPRVRAGHRPRVQEPPLASPAASPLAAPASMSTIGDLRSFAASSLDNLKRRLDALHGDSVRDLDASHSRLSKRVKMQTHGCLQLAEEADREHKKVADKITERTEVVKNSYKKFVAEVQASTSRVCKVTVAEMAKSAERAIDGLRSHYNISATPA